MARKPINGPASEKYVYDRSRREVSDDKIRREIERFDTLGLDWQGRHVPEFLFDFVAYARSKVRGED